MTEKKLAKINGRARELIRMDRAYQWRETISIVGYDIFEDGVNLVPSLVAEIRRLKKQLKESSR